MFWTDWGSSPKIEKSALNGTKRFAIVTTNLTRPYGITLDRRNKLVFWVDNGMDVIESVEYSGSNRKLLFQRRGMFFWGVTFTSSYLFINEWRKSWVSQMNAYNGTIVNNMTTGGIFPSGLIAFDSSLQLAVAVTTCPVLRAPTDGAVLGCPGNAGANYDTVCQFTCNSGYIGYGSQERRCQHDGTWSGKEFVCQTYMPRNAGIVYRSITAWNIQRLTNPKFEEISKSLTGEARPDCKLDILILTESFCNSKVPDSYYYILAYTLHGKDRQGKLGGGILAYVNENLCIRRRLDLGTNDIEALWLEVYPHKSKPPLLISGVYRPTSAKREYNINLGKNIENAYLANMELIVKEELNYDFLNSTCFYKQNRVKYLNLNQMVNIVAIPASTACLDHIQVSHPERMCIVSVINVGLSDYLPVFASRRYNQWQEQGPCREKKHLSFEYRNLKKIDKDNFIKDLNEAPWDAAFVFEETDEIIDTCKAFDLINHDILLVKLKAYGVDDGNLQLFRSYLADRQQYGNINGCTSSPLGITHGVPQGSILGPLLYLTFINDLPLVISNSTVDNYADGTTFSSSAHCTLGTMAVETNLQEDIDSLCAWSAQNRMVLNARKIKSILVTGKRLKSRVRGSSLKLQANGTAIEQVVHQKLLGVTIDQELTFKEHEEKLFLRATGLSAKAFDLINHDILLVKLKAYGVDDGNLQLFRSYLADRQQYGNINGCTSSPLGITHGVPQGSILGPLLYLTFINDLPLVISNSTVDNYADGTTFSSSAHCTLGTMAVETNLQEDIDSLCAWSAQNRMVLNARKIKSILVTGKRLKSRVGGSSLKLQANGTAIEQVVHQKLLRVTIDQELTFKEHEEKLFINCTSLTIDPGGPLSMSYCGNQHGTKCNFSCPIGYRLNGSSVITCVAPGNQNPGVWNDSVPTCEVVTCPVLSLPTYGVFLGCNTNATEMLYGTECWFSYKEGSVAMGSIVRRCTANGTWTGTDLECTVSRRPCNSPLLLVSTYGSVVAVDLDNNSSHKVTSNLSEPLALDFHYNLGYIFWSDRTESNIKRSNMDGTNITVIHNNVQSLGLAVEWNSLQLYWTDYDNRRISLSDLEGNNRTTVLSTIAPGDIVVDPHEG
ncbi:putative RNA-directed DNA polymerase from transposon BS [Stylophora pistillata]|uniref:Putative RNA-directed DNA polymerase from transposon BS n=1 Tax=Stylophora pistillata TaxID=50429 RepID=A0A2B4S4U1_STYPI|nr:putative RNA-directed DNA polymerase from transposon BS [Stylophora pistillata]